MTPLVLKHKGKRFTLWQEEHSWVATMEGKTLAVGWTAGSCIANATREIDWWYFPQIHRLKGKRKNDTVFKE